MHFFLIYFIWFSFPLSLTNAWPICIRFWKYVLWAQQIVMCIHHFNWLHLMRFTLVPPPPPQALPHMQSCWATLQKRSTDRVTTALEWNTCSTQQCIQHKADNTIQTIKCVVCMVLSVYSLLSLLSPYVWQHSVDNTMHARECGQQSTYQTKCSH